MCGFGLVWTHACDYKVTTNSFGGEIALDLMFWPPAKYRFAWYLEPEYEHDFSKAHDQSVG